MFSNKYFFKLFSTVQSTTQAPRYYGGGGGGILADCPEPCLVPYSNDFQGIGFGAGGFGRLGGGEDGYNRGSQGMVLIELHWSETKIVVWINIK